MKRNLREDSPVR